MGQKLQLLSLATSRGLAKPSTLASTQRLRTALTASLISPSFSYPQNISSLDVLEIPQPGFFLQAYTLTVAIIGITVKPRIRARYLPQGQPVHPAFNSRATYGGLFHSGRRLDCNTDREVRNSINSVVTSWKTSTGRSSRSEHPPLKVSATLLTCEFSTSSGNP
jgi:hypothetical protein